MTTTPAEKPGVEDLRQAIKATKKEIEETLRERSHIEAKVTLPTPNQVWIRPFRKKKGSLIAPDLVLCIICNQKALLELLKVNRKSLSVHNQKHFDITLKFLLEEASNPQIPVHPGPTTE